MRPLEGRRWHVMMLLLDWTIFMIDAISSPLHGRLKGLNTATYHAVQRISGRSLYRGIAVRYAQRKT